MNEIKYDMNEFKKYDFDDIKELKIFFGKYKNKKYKNIPYDYVNWLYQRKVLITDIADKYKEQNILIQQYLFYRLVSENPPELI